MHLIIISGRSGSGKTVALHALEDIGFYCIDNLPINLLEQLPQTLHNNHQQVAVSIDVRNLPVNINELEKITKKLNAASNYTEIIYLDAQDLVILRRFSDTRRKHPLTSAHKSLKDAIIDEKKMLAPLGHLAKFTIDTSNLSNHQLDNIIKNRSQQQGPSANKLQVLIQSFGFKYGLPPESDFIFDVRCLPNPYWVLNLREKNGLNQEVQDYLAQHEIVNIMLKDLTAFIVKWLPNFIASNRNYLTISVGCTGGKHRSVYITDKITEHLNKLPNLAAIQLHLQHRELTLASK